MPKYGDKTAKELDNYLKNYTLPKGKTATGLIAPVKDLKRNHDLMKKMRLKESDPFFHCKANYEAAMRGRYGSFVADKLGVAKEIWDIEVNKFPVKDTIRDLRANRRGRMGAKTGKSLKETCPTHHTKYK